MKEYIPHNTSCIISKAPDFLLHYVSISIETLILMGILSICKNVCSKQKTRTSRIKYEHTTI